LTFDTLARTVPIAVILFEFDPYTELIGDLAVRWSTIALALAIVLAMILAAVLARGGGLRIDDIPFIAVGSVPGAVIGGRLGFALEHWSFYSADPGVLIDPAIGALDLGLGVVGATLSGAYVASLLGAPLGRWLHLAAAPALFVIGTGKLAMVLTGSGQGLPSDEAWATAYAGPGPWGSVGPQIPSHPSQAYEGIATLAILAVLALVLMVGGFGRRDGRFFYVAIGLWALARTAVSTTWRDPVLVAGVPPGGVIAAGIVVGCILTFLALTLRVVKPDLLPADPATPDRPAHDESREPAPRI
jgi:prolipoprotein diacylglyceryltransferase